MNDGFNIFRIAFSMERMTPGSPSSPLNQAYLGNISRVASHITSKGGYAVLDPHNFGRFNGQIITDTNAFQTFWNNLAGYFKSDSRIVSRKPGGSSHVWTLSPLTMSVLLRSLTPITSTMIWMPG
jgi:endoglucanase